MLVEPLRRPWKRALIWLVVLGPFFFLSYGFANWVTGLRSSVPFFAFGWERYIPFVPWTIVPYWSSDLLYAVTLLMCTSRDEVDQHGKRLLTAQLLSVFCFLVFPLRFTFARPETHGLFGWLFDVLMGFDRPFNQAPSLHLSLTTVLWPRFSLHLTGFWRWAVRAWLVLIGVSTLTTYQHHFIDIPTGILAGLIAIALFPMNAGADQQRIRRTQRLRMGAIYLSASMLLASTAFKLGGYAEWLLWPSLSLAVVASAYWGDWPAVFQKQRSAMSLLMAPYSIAAWINSRWWTRGDGAAHEIAGGVWLGRGSSLLSELAALGIRSIVDVSAELPLRTRALPYRWIPMLDLVVPTMTQLHQGVTAIEEMREHRPTLVCCALGYSRSAAVVAAWLVSTGRAGSVKQAIEILRERRHRLVLNAAILARLQEYAAETEIRTGIRVAKSVAT